MTDLDFVRAIDKLVATWNTLTINEKTWAAKALANHGLIEIKEIWTSFYKVLAE
jgi:hypothetical protein